MSLRQYTLAATAFVGLATVSAAHNSCLAGRGIATSGYSSSGYSTSGYRPASPVYGFGSTGRSFTFQPSGSAPYSGTSRGTSSTTHYGPQYRFDAFTRPQPSTTARTPIETQQYYFSGRMWYPRKY
jgi:hypothetical protein